MSSGSEIISLVGQMQDLKAFRDQHWEGTFEEYLDTVRQHPEITRTAFQRIYDMILSKGWYEYYDHKKRILHYNFFDDVDGDGRDAIYGLDIPVMKLVNAFKSAAHRYGTEKRVLLLHGPVGSSKSTIVRLLKKGLETYSRTPEGAVYTFSWVMGSEYQGRRTVKADEEVPCPMHEDPLPGWPLRTLCCRAAGAHAHPCCVRIRVPGRPHDHARQVCTGSCTSPAP